MSAAFLSDTAYNLDHHRNALFRLGPFSFRSETIFAAVGLLR